MYRYVFNPFTGNFDAVSDYAGFQTAKIANGIEEGFFVRAVPTRIAQKTDARLVETSRCIGVSFGNPLLVISGGVIEYARFSTNSPLPEVGKPAFLARATDEPLLAAAGKVTMQAPATGVVAEVGIVMYVPPEYWDIRRAAVLLQVKGIVQRAST